MELKNIRHEKFAQLVASGSTYANAYREAYPTSKKWKNEAVWVQSSLLMTNSNVLERVEEIREENLKRNQATLDEVLNEMAHWLRLDPIDLFDDNYCVKKIADLPQDVRKSLASFEVSEIYRGSGKKREKIGELKKVKFIDKRAISDQFLKIFGSYAKKESIVNVDLSYLDDIIKDIED